MRRNSSVGADAPKLNDFCKGIQIKLNESPHHAIKSSNRKLSTRNSQGSVERKCVAGEDIAVVMTEEKSFQKKKEQMIKASISDIIKEVQDEMKSSPIVSVNVEQAEIYSVDNNTRDI